MNVPAVVGVPLIWPVEPLRISPPGNDPASTLQEKGRVPPEADTVMVYGWFTVPGGRDAALVIIRGGGPSVFTATLVDPRVMPP